MLVVGVFFQNCGKSSLNAVSGELTEFSSGALETPIVYVKECIAQPTQKATVAEVREKIPASFASMDLGPNSDLLAIVDNECVGKKPGGLIRDLIFQNQDLIGETGENAYSLKLDRNYSFSDLKQMADEDICIVSLDVNQIMSLFQVAGSDPSAQKHLETIEHTAVYDRLFNSNNGINTNVRVAIVDSGVDMNHPDIVGAQLKDSAGQLVGFNGMSGGGSFATDSGSHGTHVAGIVGATSGNGVGGRGILGKYVKILPVRTSNDGRGIDTVAAVNGIRWAADNGADVVNMSFGGSGDSPTYRDAFKYAISKGTFLVAAAGNNGREIGAGFNFFPAMHAKDFEGMITVGSIDASTKAISSFSNFSTSYVDIVAPGSDSANGGIISTVPMSAAASGMAGMSGTSMASPVVAGAVAAVYGLAKSRGYRPTPEQVERLVLASTDTLSGLTSRVKGGRSLNFKKLIEAVDADMGLSISSSKARSDGAGRVEIQMQPQSQEMLIDGSVKFSVAPSQNSSILLNYQWYKNGVPMQGETRSELVIKNISEDSGASYTVEVSSGKTKVMSSRANLFVGRSICTGDEGETK